MQMGRDADQISRKQSLAGEVLPLVFAEGESYWFSVGTGAIGLLRPVG
jgi:hypothetical protein